MTSNRIKKAIAGGLIGLTSLGAVAIVPAVADAHPIGGEPLDRQELQDLTPEEREALREERRAEREERRAERLALLTDTLGVTADDLQAAREAGQSLADVATANGVAVDDLIDAIVAARTEHILEHVAGGDITQEEANERIAGLTERVTERVNATPGEHGPGGPRGPHGPHGFGPGGPAGEVGA